MSRFCMSEFSVRAISKEFDILKADSNVKLLSTNNRFRKESSRMPQTYRSRNALLKKL